MRPHCTNGRMNVAVTGLLSICSKSSDIFTENVQSHLLAIDHSGGNLMVVNMQYYSQTVFVMNQS